MVPWEGGAPSCYPSGMRLGSWSVAALLLGACAPQRPPAEPQGPRLDPPAFAFPNADRAAVLRAALPALDAVAEARLSAAEAPGAAVALALDGDVVWTYARGLADVAAARPVRASSRFRVGSVTKTVTALALARLRDEGRLSFDDPLARHLPEVLRAPRHHDAGPVRLRDLLLHQAGLATSGDGSELPTAPAPSEGDLLRSLLSLPPVAPAGSTYSYSNLGFAALGLVVARAGGAPFEAVVRRSVLEPAGLAEAAWSLAEVPEADRVRSYFGVLAPLDEVKLGTAAASGGLYLGVRDLARWGALHADAFPPRRADERGPVARATLRELLELHVDPRGTSPVAHALGWDGKAACGARIYWKAGGLERFQALVAFLPEHGLAVASVANGGAGLWSLHAALLDELAKTGALTVRAALPSAEVVRAADGYLALARAFDERRAAQLFSEYYRFAVPMDALRADLERLHREHGPCERARTKAAPTSRSATFELTCEKAPLVLTLQLDARGERLTMTSWRKPEDPAPCPPVWR